MEQKAAYVGSGKFDRFLFFPIRMCLCDHYNIVCQMRAFEIIHR